MPAYSTAQGGSDWIHQSARKISRNQGHLRELHHAGGDQDRDPEAVADRSVNCMVAKNPVGEWAAEGSGGTGLVAGVGGVLFPYGRGYRFEQQPGDLLKSVAKFCYCADRPCALT